jgi:hypothetical protein
MQNSKSWRRLQERHFYVSRAPLCSLQQAAEAMCMMPSKLRALCVRRADRRGNVSVAQLDDGIVAFRTKGVWRFIIPIRRGDSSNSEVSK